MKPTKHYIRQTIYSFIISTITFVAFIKSDNALIGVIMFIIFFIYFLATLGNIVMAITTYVESKKSISPDRIVVPIRKKKNRVEIIKIVHPKINYVNDNNLVNNNCSNSSNTVYK